MDKNLVRKLNLTSIIEHLTTQAQAVGEATVTSEPIEINPQIHSAIKARKRRMDRTSNPDYPIASHNNNNNNNHVKNERLSPATPDTSSRSRSVTPSSASHPGTPPANESPLLPGVRNYSDFMRSLAAKYNTAQPSDFLSSARNGFVSSPFKPSVFSAIPNTTPTTTNNNNTGKEAPAKTDFTSILTPFANGPFMPPLIDMSSTQTLLALVRTAKEAELQGLLKNAKRTEPTSPLDLSAGAVPPLKRPKMKHTTTSSPSGGMMTTSKRSRTESPRSVSEDVKGWTVDDVYNFVASIDICAEYAQNFRDQQIDGSGLPLLTEEHLTTTMGMKLGPALKLRSLLARKTGSCNVCSHCTHYGGASSPEATVVAAATATGSNSSDSGGAS